MFEEIVTNDEVKFNDLEKNIFKWLIWMWFWMSNSKINSRKIWQKTNKNIVIDDRLKEWDPVSLSGQSLEVIIENNIGIILRLFNMVQVKILKNFFNRVYKFLDELKIKDYKNVLIVWKVISNKKTPRIEFD